MRYLVTQGDEAVGEFEELVNARKKAADLALENYDYVKVWQLNAEVTTRREAVFTEPNGREQG